MKGNGQNIHELTRIEAYLLSEKAGHPSHMDDYFWAQAEAIVRQRAVIVGIAVKAAKTKKTAAKPATAAKAKPIVKGKKVAAPKLKLGAVAEPAAPKAKKPAVKKKPVARKTGAKAK